MAPDYPVGAALPRKGLTKRYPAEGKSGGHTMAHVVFWLVALIAAALTGPVGFTIVIAAWVGFLAEAVRSNRWCRRWAQGWRPPAGAKVWRKQTLAYLVLALIGSLLGGWPGFALVVSAWVGGVIYVPVWIVTVLPLLVQRQQEAARLSTAELRAKMDATVQRARAEKAAATTCAEPAFGTSNVPATSVEPRNDVSPDLLERQTAAQRHYMDRVVEHERESAPPQVSVLKSGVVDGMGYTLYTDGSMEAILPQGMVRFGSVAELRAHLGSDSPSLTQ